MATVSTTPPGRRAFLRSLRAVPRAQLALLIALIGLTIGAWIITVHQARTMDMPMGVAVRAGGDVENDAMSGMQGMEGMASMAASGMAEAGWTLDAFISFLVAWTVMMAAMMFPASAPMLLWFRKVYSQRRQQGGGFVPTSVFASGYLLVWTTVGVVAWVLVQLGSDLATDLDAGNRATWAPIALGATLVVAGLYQLTPLKRVCLDHCRSPLGFVMRHWRDGHVGALRMGVVHGAYCLGCCWALFVVLVAAGVMSLAWMLLLTAVVFAEKVLPVGRWGPRAAGGAFLLLGVVVAAGSIDLPWVA